MQQQHHDNSGNSVDVQRRGGCHGWLCVIPNAGPEKRALHDGGKREALRKAEVLWGVGSSFFLHHFGQHADHEPQAHVAGVVFAL
jgi:hypothetical protein